jgi:pimeloyl-ACP methyl ester carboxylesterase
MRESRSRRDPDPNRAWHGGHARANQDTLPILPVHGLFGPLDDPDMLAAFAPRRVLAPDLLGYGSLSHVSSEYIDL